MGNTLFFISLFVLIMVGLALPFIEDAFDTEQAPDNELGDFDSDGETRTSFLSVLFWTFGVLPWWLDGLLWVFRGIVYYKLIELLPFT